MQHAWERTGYKMLVGELERKKSFGEPSRRWKDNIKQDLRKIRCEDLDRIHMAQDRTSLGGG